MTGGLSKNDLRGLDNDCKDLLLLAVQYGWTHRQVGRAGMHEITSPDGKKRLGFNPGTKPINPGVTALRRQILRLGVEPEAQEEESVAEKQHSEERLEELESTIQMIRELVGDNMQETIAVLTAHNEQLEQEKRHLQEQLALALQQYRESQDERDRLAAERDEIVEDLRALRKVMGPVIAWTQGREVST